MPAETVICIKYCITGIILVDKQNNVERLSVEIANCHSYTSQILNNSSRNES